jgi:7 transmembrane receptor (rhodopsin family)
MLESIYENCSPIAPLLWEEKGRYRRAILLNESSDNEFLCRKARKLKKYPAGRQAAATSITDVSNFLSFFRAGNLLVILVVTLSRRLRSITNFFLANLAVADFCVGIFCVFQNLSMYLIER